jgi:poly(A) polymerase
VYPEDPIEQSPDVPSATPVLRPHQAALTRHDWVFDDDAIDPDVQRVVRRLSRAGHEAYLVGGCVRDLLLGRRPKDFDVATGARPEDVRALFRNSRVIGRRFRLVHVLFAQQKVIEVATFRRNPNPDERDDPHADDGGDLLIRSDNTFGNVEDDAARRDFTINALFYDLEAKQILDFFGGMGDIDGRLVRTIGDPVLRFREDPVRMLRAVKFAGKLDIGLDPDLVDAMVATRDAIALAARPRLFEEVLRLMRGGASRRSLFLAWEAGLLHVLLPELATLLDDVDGDDGPASRAFRLFAELDRRTLERGAPFDDAVLWTVLLLEPLLEACEGAPDRIVAAMEFCEPVLERLAVHRRIADAMRRIVAVLPRLYAGRLGRFVHTELFDQALAVADINLAARGEFDALDRMRRTVAQAQRRQGPGPGARG